MAAELGLWPPERLRVTVEGGAGWAAVRSLLTDPQRHGVARLLPGAAQAGQSLQVVRSKLKPGRKLTAYYRTARGRGPAAAVHLAVTWFPDGRTNLLRFPADPAMPQLARLGDAAALATLVGAFCESPAGPRSAVEVVRYQPGQRHVLLSRCTQRAPVYAKTDRDDRGARAVPVARVLADELARRCPDVRVAEPLGHVPGDRTSLWWQARGRPAATLFARGHSAAPAAALVGRAARAIHDADATGPLPTVPFHDVGTEAVAALRGGEHIDALLPSVARTYRRLVAAVVEALDRTPSEQPTLLHGDLKADNLLVEGPSLRLLDFDRAREAEPAHDLAKFLADLRWWSPAAAVTTLEAAFRDGYGECDPVRWQRAELLAALVQLELAAHRAALHDSCWPLLVQDRTERAVRSFRLARGR